MTEKKCTDCGDPIEKEVLEKRSTAVQCLGCIGKMLDLYKTWKESNVA